MEFLAELVVQFVFELVGELLLRTSFRGAAWVARTVIGRLTASTLCGLGVGLAWGAYVDDGTTPRLLWVSLVAAVISLVVAVAKSRDAEPPDRRGLLRELVLPPWRWDVERLQGFALINLGIAAGVALASSAGSAL